MDLSEGIAGPYAGKWLAALGADVIKVEPPRGDVARLAGPWPGDEPDDETSGLYLYLNTNKRGITLNLETSDGRGDPASIGGRGGDRDRVVSGRALGAAGAGARGAAREEARAGAGVGDSVRAERSVRAPAGDGAHPVRAERADGADGGPEPGAAEERGLAAELPGGGCTRSRRRRRRTSGRCNTGRGRTWTSRRRRRSRRCWSCTRAIRRSTGRSSGGGWETC